MLMLECAVSTNLLVATGADRLAE